MTVHTLPLRRHAAAAGRAPFFAGLRARLAEQREQREFEAAYAQADHRVRAEMIVAARHRS